MRLFYSKKINDSFILECQECRHISKVLRKKVGDTINLTDGNGYIYIAKILHQEKEVIKLETIEKKPKKKHKYYLHIAISPTKNKDRFEWFLEKSTEIGIDEITPIVCEHSERKKINLIRCNKILGSAIKQSAKFHLPKLNNITTFNKFINQKFDLNKYIAHCKKDLSLLDVTNKNKKDNLVMIGPEGDFSLIEINNALKNNYEEISLGNSILRTETAGVIATNIIHLTFK